MDKEKFFHEMPRSVNAKIKGKKINENIQFPLTKIYQISDGRILLCYSRGPVEIVNLINKKWERRLLTSSHPNLLVFNLYRLGYFLSL